MEGWLAWVLGAAVVVGALVLADRLTAAGLFDRRRPLDRDRRPGGSPLGSAMSTLLDFYDPSHRYLTEEQQREKSTTVQKQGEGPPLVDLDAGVVEIRAPRPQPPAADGRTPR